ncbi:substrate-binding periplasmic protein [Vibrio ostreicida]|uniref:Transporter substrate-binding domain-containing protein n=1 Tax=Vibrio ostreicida TaxID=526588 RepID=A0ABT8C158_9VIBR|nr:transporter substrate-binding domain-containing protein [Vibrio ostreicida]MDN3611960.1 transporter substrate-binding domain-containing protein [Vibrio ostreicida]NPD08861.1 transporter substrate-binding domain-containing protein [Vibrio ostreicida]
MNWKQQITLLSAFTSLTCFADSVDVNYYVISEQAKPFQIETKGSSHSGIVSDIVAEVFKDSDYDVNYHTYPFNRMISILERGDAENWVTYGSPKWGKVQSENLSDVPIYTVRHSLLSSSKNPVNFSDISDLNGKVIVLLMGFDYPELKPYFANGDMTEMRVKTYQSAFRVLNRNPGELAFVEMESRISYNLSKLEQDDSQFNKHSLSKLIPDYPIHLAFSPEMDKSVQAFINQRLKELKTQGKLDTIIAKYI